MNKCLALLSAICVTLLFLCGCERRIYEIEMKTEGDILERKFTCWYEKDDGMKSLSKFPEDEIERIEKLYQQEISSPEEKKRSFIGKFVGRTPNDIGGYGTYSHFTTPMGTYSMYVERFRGDDDIAGGVANGMKASDQIIDFLIGWFKKELGKAPHFEDLRRFCDEELRQDVKNIHMYTWLFQMISDYDPECDEEMFIRMCQYLVEREYFKPEDLPSLMKVDSNSKDPFLLIQRFVAGRMGISDKKLLPAYLSFLSDIEVAEKSLKDYLRTTEEFKKSMQEWEEEKKTNPDAEEPDPLDVAADLVNILTAGSFDIFPIYDKVNIKLVCPTEPLYTNGEWDKTSKQITWSKEIHENGRLPALCYAFWSSPSAEFQQKHFGCIVLKGEPLQEYILWYKGLSKKHTLEWDKFIEGLKPGKGLKEEIESFLFSQERKVQAKREKDKIDSLADNIRALIIHGLEAENETNKEDEESKTKERQN